MTRANTRFDRALPWAAFLHDVLMAGLAFILAMYLRVGSEAFGVYRGPMLQGLPIFMLSAATATLRGGVFPRWLGWVGVVIGIAAVTPAGFFAILASGIWIVIASVLLLRRPAVLPPPAP